MWLRIRVLDLILVSHKQTRETPIYSTLCGWHKLFTQGRSGPADPELSMRHFKSTFQETFF